MPAIAFEGEFSTRCRSHTALDVLKLMVLCREGDRREGILLRQSKGWFQVSGSGHEALSVIGFLMEADDYLFTYYRDRALALAKGMTNQELASAYFAKRGSSSGGRQMPGHPSSREHNVWSVGTPTGSCLLPACGAAWAMQLEGKPGVAVGTIGDAASREGEFYEAVSFAVERQLPIVFVVEDNQYGISTNTESMNPFNLGLFHEDRYETVNARHPVDVFRAAAPAIERARQGGGPTVLHCELDRLCSHTSSDDHRVYRSSEEIEAMQSRDPIAVVSRELIEAGEITESDWEAIQQEISQQVAAEYAAAEKEPDPKASELLDELFGPEPVAESPPMEGDRDWRMVDAVNHVLSESLEHDERVVLFGEDVEDPKGGVFGLTAGLSSAHPDRVFNSPLAEATIAGVACGMACYGMRPVFELQFVDFVGPAWNQISQNLATIRWRSFGEWKCPTVLYAPYGAYLPGGSIWHSQANEALFAHTPGLRVVVPNTPEDAAGLLWTAMRAEDPTIFLLPKHRLRQQMAVGQVVPVPFGKAICRREGTDVTLVTWGNCIEPATEAAEQLDGEVSVEVIDLRSLVPWDRTLVAASLEKTGRLVVVQEDNVTCSFGATLLSDLTGDAETWGSFLSPPQLVSKPDVHIGFNPIYEYGALPDCQDVTRAIRLTMEE